MKLSLNISSMQHVENSSDTKCVFTCQQYPDSCATSGFSTMTPAYGPKTLSFLRVKPGAVNTPAPLQTSESFRISPSGRLSRALVLVSCTLIQYQQFGIFEMQMYRRIMHISWKDHRTNNSILEELKPTCRFLAEVKRRKLPYFGHVVRAENLSTHVLHGRIAGNRGRGRPRRRWTDDIKQWTGRSVAECVQCAADRSNWRSVVSVSATSDPQK